MTVNIPLFFGILGGIGVASTDIFISCISCITTDLDLSENYSGLILSIYFLATAVSCILYPKIRRHISEYRLFISALLIFSLSSLCIGHSSLTSYIILFRGMQGVAFGLMQPMIISVIKRSQAGDSSYSFSFYSFVSESFSCLAPLIGAIGYHYFAWNVPFIIIAIISQIFLVMILFNFKEGVFLKTKYDPKNANVLSVFKSGKFVVYNILSMIMIGLGWSIITILSYKISTPIIHGGLYALYTIIYAFGSFISSKHYIDRKIFDGTFIYLLPLTGGVLYYGLVFDNIFLFSVGTLVFGGISGCVYGHIMDRSLYVLKSNELEFGSSIITFSRLISTFIFITISSYLYLNTSSALPYVIIISFVGLFVLAIISKDYHNHYSAVS